MGPSGKTLRLEKIVSQVVSQSDIPGMKPSTINEIRTTPPGWLGCDEGASNIIIPPDLSAGNVVAVSTAPILYTNTSGNEFKLEVPYSPTPHQEEAHGSAPSVSVSWPSCQYSQSNAPLASMAVTHCENVTWSLYNNYSYQPTHNYSYQLTHNNNYGAYQQAQNDSCSYGYSAYGQQALDQHNYYSPGCQQDQDVPQQQQQGPEQNDAHGQYQSSVTQQLDTPTSDTLQEEEVRCLTRGLKFPSAAPGRPLGVPCVATRKQSDEESLEPVGVNVASLDEALARSTKSVVDGMKEYYKITRDNTVDRVINDPDQLAVPIRLACLTKVLVDVIARYSRHVIANPAIQETHREGTQKNPATPKSKMAGRAERLAITEYTAYKREFDKVS